MDTATDTALMDRAQQLFAGFDVTVGEASDELATEQYNRVAGELLRRGYIPTITIQFKKG